MAKSERQVDKLGRDCYLSKGEVGGEVRDMCGSVRDWWLSKRDGWLSKRDGWLSKRWVAKLWKIGG